MELRHNEFVTNKFLRELVDDKCGPQCDAQVRTVGLCGVKTCTTD